MDENIYPNSGEYFTGQEPVEQANDRKQEKAHALEALPILKELVARLDERIAFYSSVDAMPKEVKSDPVKFMNMHNANEIVKSNLVDEREWIVSLIDTHAK